MAEQKTASSETGDRGTWCSLVDPTLEKMAEIEKPAVKSPDRSRPPATVGKVGWASWKSHSRGCGVRVMCSLAFLHFYLQSLNVFHIFSLAKSSHVSLDYFMVEDNLNTDS